MGSLDILGGIWDFGSKLFQTGYNLYTNQRDFDYQKELQKQIFEREDTAVQRRMEDLKEAGINPNLAAGSSAGAGAVVGRSSTNDIGVGSALDTISAINQIKLQRQEQENKKIENEILNGQADLVNIKAAIEDINLLSQLGNDTSIRPFINKKGAVQWEFLYDGNWINIKDTPYYKNYKSLIDYNENSNKYLSRELNWYTTNQVVDMLTAGIGAVSGGVNAGANMKKASSMLRR